MRDGSSPGHMFDLLVFLYAGWPIQEDIRRTLVESVIVAQRKEQDAEPPSCK